MDVRKKDWGNKEVSSSTISDSGSYSGNSKRSK